MLRKFTLITSRILVAVAFLLFSGVAAFSAPRGFYEGATAHPVVGTFDPAGGQVTVNPTFFYVGTAVDSAGRESAFSTEASATLLPTSTTITLTWTASASTVAGYNMYRSPTTGGPYKKINTALVSGVTSFIDPFPLPPVVSGLTAKPN